VIIAIARMHARRMSNGKYRFGRPLGRTGCSQELWSRGANKSGRHLNLIVAGWALAACSLSGCAEKGLERTIVSGAITYKGAPVTDGTITFTPMAGSQVPSSGASIVDGRYVVDGRGGVPVGSHRISIEAYHLVPYTLGPGESPPRNYFEGKSREQYLPEKYNSNSQLDITIEPGSSAIAKDFALAD